MSIQQRTGLVVPTGYLPEVLIELLKADPETRGQAQESGVEIFNLPHHLGSLERRSIKILSTTRGFC